MENQNSFDDIFVIENVPFKEQKIRKEAPAVMAFYEKLKQVMPNSDESIMIPKSFAENKEKANAFLGSVRNYVRKLSGQRVSLHSRTILAATPDNEYIGTRVWVKALPPEQ